MIGTLHTKLVAARRVTILAESIATLLPSHARVLDVGCGDGQIDRAILASRPDVSIEGIDVLVRQQTDIPVTHFDGLNIPFRSGHFDVAMLVDVLHHTAQPTVLLREAIRVAPAVVIKDHYREGLFAYTTLRIMDWVGNAHHGVVLPYNYWDREQWRQAFTELDMVAEKEISPKLYPSPFSWIFGRDLHFLAKFVHQGKKVGPDGSENVFRVITT